MKKWVAVAVSLVLLAGLSGIGGCVMWNSVAEPWTIAVSFPNGAPPLGQTAKLICVVKAKAFGIHNMTLRIDLPEALELISGDLSWTGNIPKGDEVEVISALVKSVETGNWTIEAAGYVNPQENAGWGMDGSGPGPICYVSISKDSAEWGRYPPWYKKGGGVEVPLVREDAPFGGIEVNLSIPYLPILNEAIELTCTLSSDIDMPDTTAQIILRTAETPLALSDNVVTWQGDLKAGEPVSFSTKIMFKEAGKWAIEASAHHVIDEKNSYGGIDVIYLTVGTDQSTFGWPKERPALVQEEKGDVEGVESSQEEPPVEELPEPPAVSVNGTVQQK